MNTMEKDLEQRLRFSEQKRMRLKTRLAQETSGDNTFVWSVVDLMTLLLIFFIFLYSQNSTSFLSSQASNVRMAVVAKPSQQQIDPVQTASLEKRLIPDASKKILKTAPADPFKNREKDKTRTLPSTENKTDDMVENESLAQLKREAMAAIEENDRETFSIRWNDQRLIFVLGESVTFPAGQAKLLPESAPFLEKISQVIASKKDFDILVSGHTDDTPIDTYQFPSNWELSAARAISVARFLCQNGVDPHRLSIQGYAEFRPMYPNITPENKQANRRVEITLVKQKPLKAEQSYDPNPVK